MSYNDYDSEEGDSNLEYSEDEYNSEDDEFLAFHDADIEAQVNSDWILSNIIYLQFPCPGPSRNREDEEAEGGGAAVQQLADPGG